MNYYELLVSVAREANKPMITKRIAKERIMKAFKSVSRVVNVELEFVESQFNIAFREFSKANCSKYMR